jgi:hypothetical protein
MRAGMGLAILGLPCSAWAFKVYSWDLADDGTWGCDGSAGVSIADCGDDALLLRWMKASTRIDFVVNDDASADAGGDPTQVEITDAAQAAFAPWETIAFSILNLQYDAAGTLSRIAADGTNTTLFYNDADAGDVACVGASLGVLDGVRAVTILTVDAETGAIVDADIVLDSAENWVTDSADCAAHTPDVQAILTREYGHALGVGDSDMCLLDPRPTMCGFPPAACDVQRTLEGDDQAAIQCLYPEQATVLLIDQTGSMAAGGRMDDAKAAANAYVDDFADNLLTVSAFGENVVPEQCAPARDGYDLIQDWTDVVVDLHVAVDSTSACGNTPMWESMCCAVGKAAGEPPSNAILLTDTLENLSDGTCSADCPVGFCGGAEGPNGPNPWCDVADDIIDLSVPNFVTWYIIDMTTYSGLLLADGDGAQSPCTQAFPGPQSAELDRIAVETGGPNCNAANPQELEQAHVDMTTYSGLLQAGVDGTQSPCAQAFPGPQSAELYRIAVETGGLYCSAANPQELEQARLAIQGHMVETGMRRQNPVTCVPTPPYTRIDDIQVYDLAGNPVSPYNGQTVQIRGTLTVLRNTYDAGTMYVEDCSGGLQISSSSFPVGTLGAQVQVVGTVGTTFGEIRLFPVTAFTIVGPGTVPPLATEEPRMGQNYERIGSLMRIRGYAAAPVSNNRFPLVPNPTTSTSGALTVFIDPDTGINPSSIVVGGLYDITGALSRRLGVNELKPRFPADVVRVTSVPGEARNLQVTAFDKLTGNITIGYAPACDATNHIVYYGSLSSVSQYDYSGVQCSAGSGSATFNPGGGSFFFLVVGENGVDEGSYGTASSGAQIPEDTGTAGCNRSQNLGNVGCE